MQTIQLPDAQFETLTQQAAASGYEDLAAFIAALAAEAAFDPRCGMDDNQLRESAAQCARINERMKAGGEHDAREALAMLGKKFGLPHPGI